MASRFYGPQLAKIHQQAFEDFVRGLAPRLLRILRAHGIRSGHVVDLACGAGGWAGILGQRGYRVTGIDVSRAMVRLARRRVPRARFRCASLTEVKLPLCDAVTATGEAFNYVLRDAAVRGAFRRVFAALRPGGLFIFDATLPKVSRGALLRLHLRVEEDWALFVRVEEKPSGRLTREITWWSREGQGLRRGTEVHRQKLRPAKLLADWLRRTGFRVRVERGASLARMRGRSVLLVARKP